MREGNGWSGGERNCCFLNLGAKKMADIGAITRLDFPDDARSLAITDWDQDGRLDILQSARTGPRLRLMNNRLDAGAHFLSVRLEGVSCNRDAIGARLQLTLRDQTNLRTVRTLRAGEGFLAQSSKWVHFGLDNATQIDQLQIRWPDNSVQYVTNLHADHRYRIRQGDTPQRVPRGSTIALPVDDQRGEVEDSVALQSPASRSKIVLATPIAIPQIEWVDPAGRQARLEDQLGSRNYTLVNLWASWCAPCIAELETFERNLDSLGSAGIEVLPLNVDSAGSNSGEAPNSNALPKRYATATRSAVRMLDFVQRGLIDKQRPLALPTSFCWTRISN